jgi:hypothetical protein
VGKGRGTWGWRELGDRNGRVSMGGEGPGGGAGQGVRDCGGRMCGEWREDQEDEEGGEGSWGRLGKLGRGTLGGKGT